jgi:hypothetical protein
VGAGPTDRRNYRLADWLDGSERAFTNMTLSSEVELRWGERRAFRREIIYAIVVGSNVLLVLAGPDTAPLFDGFVKPISRVLLSNPRLG